MYIKNACKYRLKIVGKCGEDQFSNLDYSPHSSNLEENVKIVKRRSRRR